MFYKVEEQEYPAGHILFENGLPVEYEITTDQFGFASLTYYDWNDNQQLVSENGTTWMPDDPENSTVKYNLQFFYDDGLLVSKHLQNDSDASYNWFFPEPGKNGIIKGYKGEGADMQIISESELEIDPKTFLILAMNYYEIPAGRALVYKVKYEYDAKGRLTSVIYYMSEDVKAYQVLFKYDKDGVLMRREYLDFEGGFTETMIYKWS
jgi:hypothetical protein